MRAVSQTPPPTCPRANPRSDVGGGAPPQPGRDYRCQGRKRNRLWIPGHRQNLWATVAGAAQHSAHRIGGCVSLPGISTP